MKILNIQESNTSDVIVKSDFSNLLDSSFLENPSEHKVGITRLKIPTSGLQQFYTDGTEYWLSYGNSGKIYIPDRYYDSPNSLKDTIYSLFQDAFETHHMSNSTTYTAQLSMNGTLATQSFTHTTSDPKSAFVRVSIDAMSSNEKIRVFLNNPSGLSTIIYSGNAPSVDTTITEGGLDSTGSAFIKPRSSLIGACDSDPNGTWSIIVESDNAVNEVIDISFVICTTERTYVAPFVSFDGDYVNMCYQMMDAIYDTDIVINERLQTILGFKEQWIEYGDGVKWVYPTTTMDLANSNEIQTIPSNLTQRYLFINLSRITIRSNLPTISDTNLTNQKMDRVLMDFTINSSGAIEYLTYDIGSTQWRKYQLMSSSAINDISVKIDAIYKNGKVINIPISPSEELMCRLVFYSNLEKIAL